jgi:Zn finger protein HypA/HybF involved in hydrogenase expression
MIFENWACITCAWKGPIEELNIAQYTGFCFCPNCGSRDIDPADGTSVEVDGLTRMGETIH